MALARATRGALFALALVLTAAVAPLAAPATAAHDDASSGADAGDTFADATPVAPLGRHYGALSSTDREDWYRFHVDAGAPIDIEVGAGLITGAIQVNDAPRRPGVQLYDPNGILLDTPLSNIGDARVTWTSALVAGEYRLRFTREFLNVNGYWFCFVKDGSTCVDKGVFPIELRTPLPYMHANVLLVPPTHGNPFGSETALDYLDATLAGIQNWKSVFARFADDHPEHAFLKDMTVHVEIFDGVAPQRVGYDVVVVWASYTGPIFRGLAYTGVGAGPVYTAMCLSQNACARYEALEPAIHDGTRAIVMSLFGNAPRAGQLTPDYPEYNDVYNVAMHEFAHTWGLMHTRTYTHEHGPDLMNSPYTDVFGDGHPISDGLERTPAYCISTLDLYGMAKLYAWAGAGQPFRTRDVPNAVTLPPGMPYALYC